MDLFPQSGGIFQFGPVNERIRLVPCLEGGRIPACQVSSAEDKGVQGGIGKRVIEKSCRLHGIHDTPLSRLQCGNGRLRLTLVVRRPFFNIRKRIFFPLCGKDMLDRIPVGLRKAECDIAVLMDEPRRGDAGLAHLLLQDGGLLRRDLHPVIGGRDLDLRTGQECVVPDIRPEHPLQPLLALSAEDGIGQRRVTELDIEQADLLHDISRVLQIDGIAHLIGRLLRCGSAFCIGPRCGRGNILPGSFMGHALRRLPRFCAGNKLLHDPLGLGAV